MLTCLVPVEVVDPGVSVGTLPLAGRPLSLVSLKKRVKRESQVCFPTSVPISIKTKCWHKFVVSGTLCFSWQEFFFLPHRPGRLGKLQWKMGEECTCEKSLYEEETYKAFGL